MMMTMKKYILAILLLLPVVAQAANIRIMGISCTDNTTINTSTSISDGTLSAGTITYNSSSHTVTLDGVVAHCYHSTEFISNLRNSPLTVIVNSASTITARYIFDVDNGGEPQSYPVNLTLKSGAAGNQPVDLTLNVEKQDFLSEGDNACAVIMESGVTCSIINLNIKSTKSNPEVGEGNGYLIVSKSSSDKINFYNSYVHLDNNVTLKKNSNGTITYYGMQVTSSETPFVAKRVINRTTGLTSSISPLTGLSISFGGGSMSPASINVTNSAGGYTCSFPLTVDDIFDYLPYKNAGGVYEASVMETERAIVTEANPIVISYSIAAKPINGDNITISEIPMQIYDGTNAPQPAIRVYDNGTLLINPTDYTVTYGANTTEGVNKGTVTIAGTGNYSGSKILYFDIVKEYFTENSISYHTKTTTTLSVGAKTGAAIATTTEGLVTVPSSVTHEGMTFSVTGVEATAFKDCNLVTALNLPATITAIKSGAFTGCSALRYIDISEAMGYTPASLDRTIATSPFCGVPKQTLVFLYATKTIQGENYVYKVHDDDYRCDVFKIYEDVTGTQLGFTGTDYMWAYENPKTFTANKVVNSRQLTGDKYYTTCLPYALEITADMKVYTLHASSDILLGFEEVLGTLEAFTPYVIAPQTSGQLLKATNVTIPATTAIANFCQVGATSATAVGGHKLVGTFRYMTKGANGCYIMQSGNQWKLFDTTTSAYPAACILPMRAYIIGSDYPSPSRQYITGKFTNADGSTTEVEQLLIDEDKKDHTFYDLNGRRVNGSVRGGVLVSDGIKQLPTR